MGHSKTANPKGVLKISATFRSTYVGDGRDARESNEMNGRKNNRERAETNVAMQRVNKNASRSMVNEPRAWMDFYACSCPALRSLRCLNAREFYREHHCEVDK